MAHAGDRPNRAPSDRQILSAMRSVEAKAGQVNCGKYRVHADLADGSAAQYLADEVTARKQVQFNAHDGERNAPQVALASHAVLDSLSHGSTWAENRQTVGVIFHRYWAGLVLTIDEHGVDTLPGDDFQVDVEYEYQLKPLAQLMWVRLSSVWGQDGKPGNTVARENSATRALVRTLLAQAERPLPMGGTTLPMVEIRSIKIGELNQVPIYGFTVLGSFGSLMMRINAAATQLKDMELELITFDDYRDRLVNLKLAGNQEMATTEALTYDRKFML